MKVKCISSTKSKKIILFPEDENDSLFLQEFFLMFENTNGKIECKDSYYCNEDDFFITTYEYW